MADNADNAQDLNELYLSVALEKQLTKPEVPFSGSCLYCEEPINIGRFCCKECRIDWERKIRKK